MKQTQPKPGIRERILAATSKKEVADLMNQALVYKRISMGMLRKCHRAAEKRIQEVEA